LRFESLKLRVQTVDGVIEPGKFVLTASDILRPGPDASPKGVIAESSGGLKNVSQEVSTLVETLRFLISSLHFTLPLRMFVEANAAYTCSFPQEAREECQLRGRDPSLPIKRIEDVNDGLDRREH
jgi:hypothetical protein